MDTMLRYPSPSKEIRRFDATYWIYDDGKISLVGRYQDIVETLSRYGLTGTCET